jgi:Kef-type K+ transport system membrane component KefB
MRFRSFAFVVLLFSLFAVFVPPVWAQAQPGAGPPLLEKSASAALNAASGATSTAVDLPASAGLSTTVPTSSVQAAASAAMTAASAPPLRRTSSAAPLWTLEGLRAADPVLGLALLMIVAILLAEALHRLWRLPRSCGHMITGAIASPLLLRLLDRHELDVWKPVIDLAVGALLFELGSRIRPRWLLDNPWMALGCVMQALLCGAGVGGALLWFGASPLSAAVAAAVSMSTSPVIVPSVVHEIRSRGQVTERLLMMTAVNSVLAVLALKVLWVALASGATASSTADWWPAISSALQVVLGSLFLGVGCGLALDRLSPFVRGTPAMPVLQIGLVITASMAATQWTLSPLLALLAAGVTARARMTHGLTVEPHLGSAGAVLNVLLFISMGLLFTLDGIWMLWPWVLALIMARLLGTALGVGLLARTSGLSWRQGGALTLALQPMSSLAVLLAADTLGWSSQLPGVDANTLRIMLIAGTIMQITGPVWTHWSLEKLAHETDLTIINGGKK